MTTESRRTALITGATGLLGRAIAHQFALAGWSTIGTGFSRASTAPSSDAGTSRTKIVKLDLTDTPSIATALDAHNPSIVIHSAASRFPDVVDKNPAAARALNTDSSAALAHACAARGILLVYISTDYVFPGSPGQAPYTAQSTPAPTNLYGQTKLDGERAILDATAASGSGFVLRVPVLYGAVEPAGNHAESAVNVLVDAVWKAQKEPVVMDHWSLRYPTCTEDIGRVLAEAAEKLLALSVDARKAVSGGTRILHFSAEERMTKFEICETLAGILGLELGQMRANEQGNDPAASVQRPYDCHLSTAELQELGVDVRAQKFEPWFRRYLRAVRR